MIIMAAMALNCLASKPATTFDADSAKADYAFFESAKMSALDDPASAFELTKRAAELSPQSADLGFQYGLQLMTIARNDSLLFTKGYNLADRYFNEGATDYYNLFTFGSINDQLGHTAKSIAIWQRLDSIYPSKSSATLKLAERLSQTGDSANIQRAMALYDRLETVNGKNIAVTYRKMGMFMQQGDTTAVIDEVHSLVESAPLNADFNLLAADIYAAFNFADSARLYYDKAVTLDPNSGVAIYRRANFFLAQGDSTTYQREVREALRHESLDFDTKMELITGIVRDSYPDSTQRPYIVELFNDMIDQNPREASLRDLYCAYLHAIDDFKGAAEQTEYAVDVDPADETRWHNLISLYITQSDYEKASDAANRALRYFPNNTDFITTVGSAMVVKGNYDAAEAYFLDLLEKTDSTDIELIGYIYTELGDIASHAGDRTKAIEYYDKAFEVIPHNALLLNNYAYLLSEERIRLDDAEKMSSESLLSRPNEPTYLDTYAWILFQKKDFKGAQRIIDRAIENSETPAADIYEHAGDIYFFLGETDSAIDFWDKAYELDPDNASLKTKVETRSYPIK